MTTEISNTERAPFSVQALPYKGLAGPRASAHCHVGAAVLRAGRRKFPEIVLKLSPTQPFTGCMSNLLGAISMFQSSVQGIGREFNRAAVAAAKISRADRGDKVTISAEARSQPIDSEEAATGGIEAAMVDMRVAKYGAIANMRVLSVADDLAHEEAKIVK